MVELVLVSGSASLKAAVRGPLGLQSLQSQTAQKQILFSLTQKTAGRTQFPPACFCFFSPSLLTGCWSKDHPQFFVTSASPESSSQIVTCFIRGSEKLQREKMSKKDITVFRSLISG